MKKKILLSISLISCTFLAKKHEDNNTLDEYFYSAIEPLLTQYQRPFTLIELWPKDSKLTFSIAREFPQAACIMIENKRAEKLLLNCKQHQDLNNIALLRHKMSIEDLIALGECEHIDVTIVPDLSLKFREWQKAVDAVLTFGDFIILETPPHSSSLYRSVKRYFKEKNGFLIAKPSDNKRTIGELYQFNVQKKFLLRRRWDHPKLQKKGEYQIVSSFTEKKLVKDKIQYNLYAVTPWHAGINLFTFKNMDGAYPTNEMIRALLQPLSTIEHNDLRIFNLIIQGNNIVPIDGNEIGRNDTVQNALPEIMNQFKKQKCMSLEDLYSMDCKFLKEIDNLVSLNQ